MAMSRKHYTEAAEIIKANLDAAKSERNEDEAIGAEMAVKNVARDLAGMFKRDNSAFDRARFMDACGF